MKYRFPSIREIIIWSIGIGLWIIFWYVWWGERTSDPDVSEEVYLSTVLDQYRTIDTLFVEQVGWWELSLTAEGEQTIQGMRDDHQPTTLIKNTKNDESLCAGYIYELTDHLRGPLWPVTVGMLHPKTKKASDARELPYSYRWKGGVILYDIGDTHGPKLKSNPSLYPSIVSRNELLKLFSAAFTWDSLLGDIGFLYNQSGYLSLVGEYGNYNSHIAKHMWLSDFHLTVKSFSEPGNSNSSILQDALGCEDAMREHMQHIFSRYDLKINGHTARFLPNDTLWIKKQNIRESYDLQTLDEISYIDVVLAHFREGEKIDSLFQFSCQGAFYPINVISINPKFIEKY